MFKNSDLKRTVSVEASIHA